jgi:anti-anti-sigma factor
MPNAILVIDDERATLSMFQRLLPVFGFEQVLVAENGAQGLEIFKTQKPAIVLTDIKMPGGMDGIEVLTRIKEEDPAAEVIVITGHGDMDLAIKALNLDATDFINKPIQRDDLKAALRRARERIRISRDKGDDVLVHENGQTMIVDIQGNLTSRSEGALNQAFARTETAKHVLLAFNENASVNGAGIALLTQFLLDCRKRGQESALAGLSEGFQRVFALVGIDKIAPLYSDRDQALKAWQT